MATIGIIGAGIIGCTTAYMLHEKGHDVTLIDKEDVSGTKASNSNAAQLSFDSVYPLASFGELIKYIPHILSSNPKTDEVFVTPEKSKDLLRFLTSLAYHSLPVNYKNQFESLLRLAHESRDALKVFMEENPDIDFNYTEGGKLYLHDTKKGFEESCCRAEKYIKNPDLFRAYKGDDLLALAPHLQHRSYPSYGGIYYPGDCIGDSGALCRALIKKLSHSERFSFLSSSLVKGFVKEGRAIKALEMETGKITFDKYVIAAGMWSLNLLKPLGISMPFYPLKGYTLTLKSDFRPAVCTSDTGLGIAYVSLGDRLRISGILDMDSPEDRPNPDRVEFFKKKISQGYPDIDVSEAELRWGMRPAYAGNMPIIGQASYKNLYLNIGHGMWGWTLSFGSAKRLADQLE